MWFAESCSVFGRNWVLSKESKKNGAPFSDLNDAVEKALRELKRLREKSSRVEIKNAELEEVLKGIAGGTQSPAEMAHNVKVLSNENQDLRSRLDQGRESVERLLTRIRFLEEQR
jgi:predicted RNase H-like nuclease (RuvC/YqgF family)